MKNELPKHFMLFFSIGMFLLIVGGLYAISVQNEINRNKPASVNVIATLIQKARVCGQPCEDALINNVYPGMKNSEVGKAEEAINNALVNEYAKSIKSGKGGNR